MGPFSTPKIYTNPDAGKPAHNEPGCQLKTYNAKEHPAFEFGEEWVISYNVTTVCGDVAFLTNVDNYRPRYVVIPA